MKTISAVSAAIALVMLLGSIAAGQPMKVYRPGDTVTLKIEFEGRDAGKIHVIWVWMNREQAKTRPGQSGFQSQLTFSNAVTTGPGTFEVSCKILSNDAAGAYSLHQIRIATDPNAPVEHDYLSGLPPVDVKIENPNSFEAPSLKSVTDVSRR